MHAGTMQGGKGVKEGRRDGRKTGVKLQGVNWCKGVTVMCRWRQL